MRNHLSPAGPRLVVLIDYRTVAAQEYGNYRWVGRLDTDALTYGSVTVEFQCQFVVPVQFRLFTGFDAYRFFVGYAWIPFVDDKCLLCELPFPGGQIIDEKTA